MTLLVLSVLGLIFGVVAQIVLVHYTFPFIWMLTFITPAEVINTLFFCLQFYLSGGLFHYVFDSEWNSSWSLKIMDIMRSPISTYFWFVFGFSVFFLFFQMSVNLTKRIFESNRQTNYIRPNYLYLFLFFLSMIFVPIIFTLLNLSVMLFIQVIKHLFNTNQSISIDDFANFYLRGDGRFPPTKWYSWTEAQSQIDLLKKIIPENETISKLLDNVNQIISKESYNDFHTQYQELIDKLQLNNPQRAIIVKNIHFLNNFIDNKLNVILQIDNQLGSINQAIYPSMQWKEPGDYNKALKAIIAIQKGLENNETFFAKIQNENLAYVDNDNLSITKQLFTIYSQKVFGDTLPWNSIHFGVGYWPGTIPITNYHNYVVIWLTGIMMSSCLPTFIRLIMLIVGQLFRSIYLLIVSPFVLVKSLDDDGFSFQYWWKEITNNYFLMITIVSFFMISAKTVEIIINNISVKDCNFSFETERYIYAGLIGTLISACFVCSNWFGSWLIAFTRINNKFATLPGMTNNNSTGSGNAGGAHPKQDSESVKSTTGASIKEVKTSINDFSQWKKNRLAKRAKI